MSGTRTLLLLYPGPVRWRQERMRRHRAALRARGVRVVLADDWIDAADAEHFDAVIEVPPPERVGETVEALLAVPCDAVLAQSEAAILPGALLNACAGRRGLPLAAALRCVGKHLAPPVGRMRTRRTATSWTRSLGAAKLIFPACCSCSAAPGVRRSQAPPAESYAPGSS